MRCLEPSPEICWSVSSFPVLVVWTRTHGLLTDGALQSMYRPSFYYRDSLGNGLSMFTRPHMMP